MPCDYIFKYIVIGDIGIGKSSLLFRLTENSFRQGYVSTIGIEFGIHELEILGSSIKLYIFDTAGQERYRSITTSHYRDVAGALLVYDISRRETFDNLAGWLKEVRKYGNPNITITLVGHKSDLEQQRAVNIEEGEKFAKKNGFKFLEASSKTGHNVKEAFSVTTAHILQKIREGALKTCETSGIRTGYGSDDPPRAGEAGGGNTENQSFKIQYQTPSLLIQGSGNAGLRTSSSKCCK